jgi:hypothetical protein
MGTGFFPRRGIGRNKRVDQEKSGFIKKKVLPESEPSGSPVGFAKDIFMQRRTTILP